MEHELESRRKEGCVCVCVCVRERERERDGKGEKTNDLLEGKERSSR